MCENLGKIEGNQARHKLSFADAKCEIHESDKSSLTDCCEEFPENHETTFICYPLCYPLQKSFLQLQQIVKNGEIMSKTVQISVAASRPTKQLPKPSLFTTGDRTLQQNQYK